MSTPTPKNPLAHLPTKDILALAESLHQAAVAHIRAGKPVTQRDIAIVNNSRQLLTKLRLPR